MRSPAQQPFHLSLTDNRKSSDSWNSSNNDPADDLDLQWKSEHIRLLTRVCFLILLTVSRWPIIPLQTLDALPAHVLTPFIGPIPPSNLLDKIARGVAQAKGSTEWPYSLRATRAKLVELCRARAKEVSAEQKRQNTIEEEDGDQDLEQFREVLKRTTNIKPPLYRQSSMDFMQSAKLELCDTDAFTRYFPSHSYRFAHFHLCSNAELLAAFTAPTACSPTPFIIPMHAHRPLILRLSIFQHPPLPHYILLIQQFLSGKSSLQTHLSVARYLPCQPIPRLLCSHFLVYPHGTPIRLEIRASQ
jgi:hypothetical protein